MAVIKFIPGRRRKPPQLSELMQTLPQELFDNIYGLTFTATPGLRELGYIRSYDDGRTFHRCQRGRQFLGADSRALLEVDRASRAQYASSYYGQGSMFIAHTPYAARTWLQSVPQHHRDLIRVPFEINRRACFFENVDKVLQMGRTWDEVRDARGPLERINADVHQVSAELHKMGFVDVPTQEEYAAVCDYVWTSEQKGTPMHWTWGYYGDARGPLGEYAPEGWMT